MGWVFRRLLVILLIPAMILNDATAFTEVFIIPPESGAITQGMANADLSLVPGAKRCEDNKGSIGFVGLRFGNCSLTHPNVATHAAQICVINNEPGQLQLSFIPSTAISNYAVMAKLWIDSSAEQTILAKDYDNPSLEAGKEYQFNAEMRYIDIPANLSFYIYMYLLDIGELGGGEARELCAYGEFLMT